MAEEPRSALEVIPDRIKVEVVETLPPHQILIRDAFFGWKERGYESAWHSIYAAMKESE